MKEVEIKVTLTEESLTELANRLREQMDHKKPYYTTEEVATLLSVSKQTIQNHIASGLLKANKPGKSYIISHQNLEDYVNNE